MRGSVEHDGKRGSTNHSNTMLRRKRGKRRNTHPPEQKIPHISTSHTEYFSTNTENTVAERTIVITTLDQSEHGDTHTHVREIS